MPRREDSTVNRVIAYVDGFNLYYGLRSKHWRWFYWLNIQSMVQRLLKPDQTLTVTKYFTSIVDSPPVKHQRQNEFLEVLRTLTDFKIYYGHYLSDTVTCVNCGYSYQAFHEKMTDVNIAVELMSDAYQDTFDIALLVSADSDLVGPIQAMRQLFSRKRVLVAFPPARYSNALKRVAHGYLNVSRNILYQSVFPDQVVAASGHILQRPATWH